MSSKPPQLPPRTPGQTFFCVCLGGVAAAGLGLFLWPSILWGSIHLSLAMGWATWGDTTPYEPWDGCVDPQTEAERDNWVEHAQTTGEPLCDPRIVEMEFPTSSESAVTSPSGQEPEQQEP